MSMIKLFFSSVIQEQFQIIFSRKCSFNKRKQSNINIQIFTFSWLNCVNYQVFSSFTFNSNIFAKLSLIKVFLPEFNHQQMLQLKQKRSQKNILYEKMILIYYNAIIHHVTESTSSHKLENLDRSLPIVRHISTLKPFTHT